MSRLRLVIGLLLLAAGTLPAASLEATVTFARAAPPAVLVWLPDYHGWKPAGATIVDQREQAFRPLIVVAPPGGIVEFRNSDSQAHNIFALDSERGIDTDLGLGAPGSTLSLTVAWPLATVVKHGCKIHPQMQLWIMSLDSPYAAVSELADGALSTTVHLTEIPADARQLRLWAPRCETLTMDLPSAGAMPVVRKGKPVGTLSVRLLP
jgi:plastocyanin